MEALSTILEVLRGMLLQLPSLLTIVGCIVASIIRWKRHPKVSLTVVISLVLLLVITFIFPFIYAFVPRLFRKPDDDFKSLRTIYTVISFFYNSSWGIALAVLLAAIFMRRKGPTAPAEAGKLAA